MDQASARGTTRPVSNFALRIPPESIKTELADDGRPAPAAHPGDCCGLVSPTRSPPESFKIELAGDGRPAPAAHPGDCCGLPSPTRSPDGSERPKTDPFRVFVAPKMLRPRPHCCCCYHHALPAKQRLSSPALSQRRRRFRPDTRRFCHA